MTQKSYNGSPCWRADRTGSRVFARRSADAPVLSNEDRQRLEQRLNELRTIRNDFDAKIDALEAEIHGYQPQAAVQPGVATSVAPAPAPITVDIRPTADTSAIATARPVTPQGSFDLGGWGSYEPGKGYTFISGDNGEISMSLISYVRYLNQLGLDRTYTDSFGRTTTLDLRQDVMLNKVNLTFKGWLFDPNFLFRVWVWTQNPAMGEGAQVVVGGQLGYHFNDYITVNGGVSPLPSDRTTNWTYPNWLKMDNRTIADEFFRGIAHVRVLGRGQDRGRPPLSSDDRQQSVCSRRERFAVRLGLQHAFGRVVVDAHDGRVWAG